MHERNHRDPQCRGAVGEEDTEAIMKNLIIFIEIVIHLAPRRWQLLCSVLTHVPGCRRGGYWHPHLSVKELEGRG